jgi:hypothetical protein
MEREPEALVSGPSLTRAGTRDNAVTVWFGAHFVELHPLLQALHRNGGTLKGVVDIELGYGIAGWVGRRLARTLGMPTDAPRRGFEVDIRHDATCFTWSRRFDNGALMSTVFEPVGTWPNGYWVERTGTARVKLTVDVIDGGWYWRALGITAGGLSLPLWLFPRSSAYKRIDDGKYVFGVEFALPLLGMALRYRGALDAQPEGTRA